MSDKLEALLERAVVAFETLAAAVTPAAVAEPVAATPKTRARKTTAAAAPAATEVSQPAPAATVNEPVSEPKVITEEVTKEQVRALLQQYGELDSIVNALKITKRFATEERNAKDQPYTGESIGTIDPKVYGKAAAALAEAIAAKLAAKKAPDASPLDD